MDISKISVITVSYNAPDLIKQLLSSFRAYYANPVYIIDGSDSIEYQEISAIVNEYENVYLKGFGYNIHHGPGMAWAINELKLKGKVLFLDSDVIVVNSGMIESLNHELKGDMYGVGGIQFVNSDGFDIDESDDAIPYLHPACMLCNIEVVRMWPMPIKHGAPMVETMRGIHESGMKWLIGNVDWVKNDFEQGTNKNYIIHDWKGTVNRTSGYHLEEWQAALIDKINNPSKQYSATVYNPDLLAIIPNELTKVVEVGCNSGALAKAYKETNSNCTYIGIEIDVVAAKTAKSICDDVLIGDIEGFGDDFYDTLYDVDCWVFGDVLEHLRDPWRVLKSIRNVIQKDALIVVCLPNMQHWSIQARLSIGDFRYENSGLLDRTHLRWFTRLTMLEMFRSCGFEMLEGYPRIFNEPQKDVFIPIIKSMAEAAGKDGNQAINDALAIQYVLKLRPI